MSVAAPPQLESFSPAGGRRLGAVPAIEPGEVQAVVESVAAVQPYWAALPLADRARYLRRAAQVVVDSLSELSELLSAEQGRPRNEAYAMELVPTIDGLHWIAAEGQRLLGGERVLLPIFMKTTRARHAFEPLGVVGVIAPWSSPWAIPFGEVAMALMCGNGVVLKPASLTPLIGQQIQAVFERAGVPEGLVRTVHGGGDVGRALVESSAAKIFFTGSVEVGRSVALSCAEQLKACVLQLGGKDPMIVCSDADIPNAVAGALWGGFANAGQTCAGIERVYVMRDVAERFREGLVAGAQALRLGDPLGWDTEIGPMVSSEQAALVAELLDDAVAAGATLHCGGPVSPPGLPAGDWIAPAVLTGVRADMRIVREEILGPVVPIVEVDSEEEAVALANDSELGLGASVWTTDRARGERTARRLEAGMAWVNDHMSSHGAAATAWGATKHSGLGRTHSRFGFYECVSIKTTSWDPGWARRLWWQPYDRDLGHSLEAAAKLLYGRDADKPGALRGAVRPFARVAARALRRR